jgi:hypothetical protein
MIYQTQKNCWQGLADRCQQFFFTSSHELSQKKLSLPKINSMSSPQTTSYAHRRVSLVGMMGLTTDSVKDNLQENGHNENRA